MLLSAFQMNYSKNIIPIDSFLEERLPSPVDIEYAELYDFFSTYDSMCPIELREKRISRYRNTSFSNQGICNIEVQISYTPCWEAFIRPKKKEGKRTYIPNCSLLKKIKPELKKNYAYKGGRFVFHSLKGIYKPKYDDVLRETHYSLIIEWNHEYKRLEEKTISSISSMFQKQLSSHIQNVPSTL